MTTEGLILVAGLPRAGKSTLAERLCALGIGAEHLPLDKYFLPVPEGRRFLDWVQEPTSLDWQTLERHLRVLRSGRDCFTPALDWSGSGRRLNEGGDVAHPSSRLVRGGARFYVIPGCFAFEAPVDAPAFKIFVETPLHVLAERYAGERVPEPEVAAIVARYCPGHQRLRAYGADADQVANGESIHELVVRDVATKLQTHFCPT